LEHDAEVELWLVDHAPQLEHAKSSLAELGFAARVQTFTRDLLDPELQLPGPVNIVWLSQVLDCLPPANACSVLTKAREALAPGGRLFVLEPCTDLQPHPAGAFCLNQTSLYFACLANGTSRMYDSGTLQSWFAQTGFVLVARHDGLGYGHSLFECARAE
jgi:hypothetical protein